jgi:predicted phosphodiesterase
VTLALLYDVHGNLAALEAVLADAGDVDGYVVGGDVAAFGPEPKETLERLQSLADARWLRGNADRWLVETPTDRPEVWRALHETRVRIEWEDAEWLYARATQQEEGDVLFVHASPLTDVDTFGPAPHDEDERRLGGLSGRTVVFGHSHRQFPPREGPNATTLLNPGSVGQPLDGDPRAAYALLDAGAFELRRVEYDHGAAAERMRSLGTWAEAFARRIEFAST